MGSKKSYSRYFIILQEDEKGHSISHDKQSSGYTKIETKNDKCKVSFYVQNIKREKTGCYMFLIANKKDSKKIINLGPLNIDDNGRADVTYECGMYSIGDSNISMDKIGGAAVGKFIGGRPIFIMSGFSSTDIPGDWKNYLVVDCVKPSEDEKKDEEKEKKDEKKEAKEEKKEEKCREDEKTAIVQDDENDNKPEADFDEYERHIDKCKCNDYKEKKKDDKKKELEEDKKKEEKKALEEDKKKEEKKALEEDKKKEEKKALEEDKKKEEKKALEEDKKKEEKKEEKESCEDIPKDTAGIFFKNVMKGMDEIKGVCGEIKYCKWYKQKVNELENMCNISNYNKYTVVYYPMINYYPYIRKYGYYMMGLKCDKDGNLKYLVYGMPGTKDKEDQPFGGKTGFVTWVPVQSDGEHESAIGYWLMFYDFKNSTIVVPMK